MLRLLQDVRGYRNRGLTIDVRGIDSAVRSAREREASMALNLRTLVDNLPYDHVVVLTGRRHARRTPRFLGVGPGERGVDTKVGEGVRPADFGVEGR